MAALLDAGDSDATALVAGRRHASPTSELRQRIGAGRPSSRCRRGRSSCCEARTSVEFVTTYLALLDDGHVPLLAGEHADRLAEAWDADAVVDVDRRRAARRAGDRGRRPCAAPRPRPAAQHVRLDRLAEARPALARQPDQQRPRDRRLPRADARPTAASRRCRCTTATACPCCTRTCSPGRSVVMTTASVVDPCFAAAMRRRRGHQRRRRAAHVRAARAGRTRARSTSRRCASSPRPAGGCGPSASRAWLERSRQWGVDFFVMYGQTEATARMAYLPPELAARHPAGDRRGRSPAATSSCGRSTACPTASASSSTAART